LGGKQNGGFQVIMSKKRTFVQAARFRILRPEAARGSRKAVPNVDLWVVTAMRTWVTPAD